MLCAVYEMTEIDNGEMLKAFLDRSGVSMSDVGAAVSKLGVEPKGKLVTKGRVWNYIRGTAKMPGWFVDALNQTFPSWQDETMRNKSSRRTSTVDTEYSDDGNARFAPLVPSIGDSSMKNAFDTLATETWQGPVLQVPRFLDPRFPVQYVDDDLYSPALKTGDVIQIKPGANPLLNRLFAIREKAGQSHYAACVERDAESVWLLYDGSNLPLKSCDIAGAVTARLPQYTPGQEIGEINSGGLDITSQIVWPKKL